MLLRNTPIKTAPAVSSRGMRVGMAYGMGGVVLSQKCSNPY
jgi:hypothetical protein